MNLVAYTPMKTESFFIGPYDEDTIISLQTNLADLKYIHGVLTDCFAKNLKAGSSSTQMEDIILYLNSVITKAIITGKAE